jgi:hypothetical protein
MLISLTQSSGQTLVLEGDTVHCYNTGELRSIASSLIDFAECDTLLSITQKELSIKDSIINILGLKAASYESQIAIRISMLEEYEDALDNYEYMLIKEQVAHRRTKLKWNIYIGLSVLTFGYLITK